MVDPAPAKNYDIPVTISMDEIAEIKVKLQAILFSIEEGIVMTDFDGAVKLLNDKAKVMLGIRQGYPYQKKFLDYVTDEWVKDKLEFLLQSKEAGVSAEIDVYREGGDVYFHATKNFVTTAQNVVLGHVLILRNVTAEKQLEKLKDDFVHSLTHDLKSPLTSLQGFLKLFLQNELGTLTTEQRHYMQIMSHSSEDMLKMINNILDVAKLESGKMVLSRDRWNAGENVARIVESLQGAAKACQLRVFQSGDRRNVILSVDGSLLERVIYNILDNSLKFTPSGGTIEIKIKETPEIVEFTIQDTGKGIPQECLGEIFNKFKQVPGTKGGSGLGLTIVNSIVQAHGGRTEINSKLGAGTTVRFWVPKAENV